MRNEPLSTSLANSGWMRTSIHFGVPFKRFSLDYRSKLGQEFHLDYTRTLARNSSLPEAQVIERVAKELCSFLSLHLRHRFSSLTPAFTTDHLSAIAINLDFYRSRWMFEVLHPGFPLHPDNQSAPPIETVESCVQCGNGFKEDNRLYWRNTFFIGHKVALEANPRLAQTDGVCCSESCFTANPLDSYLLRR